MGLHLLSFHEIRASEVDKDVGGGLKKLSHSHPLNHKANALMKSVGPHLARFRRIDHNEGLQGGESKWLQSQRILT